MALEQPLGRTLQVLVVMFMIETHGGKGGWPLAPAYDFLLGVTVSEVRDLCWRYCGGSRPAHYSCMKNSFQRLRVFITCSRYIPIEVSTYTLPDVESSHHSLEVHTYTHTCRCVHVCMCVHVCTYAPRASDENSQPLEVCTYLIGTSSK